MNNDNVRPVGDLVALPEVEFGHRAPQWWGMTGLIAIEGTIFALCLAAYFFLRLQVATWPPYGIAPPSLVAGTVNTALMLVGFIPMVLTTRYAHRHQPAHMLLHLWIFVLLNLAILVVRWFEFRDLHVKWDTNAYGSIVWITLIFHSLHLLTTLVEKAVLGVYLATHELEDKYILDLDLNLNYWYFITGSWVVIYGVIYFGPRMLN